MKPLSFLKWAWPVEVVFLIMFGSILCLMPDPEPFGRLIQFLPAVTMLIGGQGAIAFGGPALKRAQNNHNGVP